MSPEAGNPLAIFPQAGRHSAIVRETRKLARSSAERKARKVAVVEGPSVAGEVLAGPYELVHALVSRRLLGARGGPGVVRQLAARGGAVHRVEDPVLESLSDAESSQGVMLVIGRPRWDLSTLLAAETRPLVVVAHGIQDPGNLGALARIADAAWGTALVAIGGADPWSPRAVRGAAGSIPRLPVIESAHAPALLQRLSAAGLRLAATDPHAGGSYREADLSGPLALILGSEGAGLPPGIAASVDLRISIPMRPGVESLNVATAAAVILFSRAAEAAPER